MRFLLGIILFSLLLACSDDSEVASSSEDTGAEAVQDEPAQQSLSSADEELAEEYRKKVSKRVSSSVRKSLAREWQVSEQSVECLYEGGLNTGDFSNASRDPEVGAVFESCGIDPSVVD